MSNSGAQGTRPGMEALSKSGARPNGPIGAPGSPVSSTVGPSLAPEDLEDEPQSSLAEVTQMWIKFAKAFAAVFPIYILGYFGFSFSWILIGLAAIFWWKRTHGSEDNRINRALAFLDHEDKAVKQIVPTMELPPWVHYPDVERVEWLNKTVKQMWPFICQFVEKVFRDTIEPAVQGANPYLSSFCFTKIDMGNKPVRVNGVKVYTENVDQRQVIMDLQISFVGNTQIDVDIKKYYCRAGIKCIQLCGVLRVVMEPLLGDMPLVGALSLFFLKKPLLDVNWTGLTNMLDIPGVNGLSDGIIQDIICSILVLPNRINIPLVGDEQLAKLRFPLPKGVLRIHFLEAQELLSKDTFLGGLIKGKSDPYGVLKIGTYLFKSKVIHDTLNPKWNVVFEALVYDQPEQNLEIELFDEDTDQDDFLGSLNLNVAELQQEQKVDEWFTLDEVSSGKLHLQLDWLTPMSTPDNLDQAMMSIRENRCRTDDGLSSALLVVFLDSARSLSSAFEGTSGHGDLKERRSMGLVSGENVSLCRTLFSAKKVVSVPSPFVHFRVDKKSYDSKIRYKTKEPVWEEAFTFLIQDPRTQCLDVEVKDHKHDCTLGLLTLPLTRLLEAEEMMLNQRFPLKNSAPGCTLKMKIALRVLWFSKAASLSSNATPSAAQVRKTSSSSPTPQPSVSDTPNPATPTSNIPCSSPNSTSVQDLLHRQRDPEDVGKSLSALDKVQGGGGVGGQGLLETGRSTSNLASSSSQPYLAGTKEPTPSIASDISNPYAAQELQQRLQQLQNGSGLSYFPLGEVQLTIRHSPQRNKLVVVVHACRNLIAFSEQGSDPYVRLYLLPDKRRSGRRKTHTFKKTLNPIYDQTFEFSVPMVDLHRRTLDVAVKNGGGLLSKHKGLLGKVLVDLIHEDITKGWTQWYELTEDGFSKSHQV
ncbi:extended synaptotagmin-2-B [Thalassophryne amazonica]|uniref:extended synaptotagmin-2-B n=1 Tax=Thalassophryne amazonica TaxID=390379 RepID=UPI001472573A|nr:extended synaptotagmin-2-B [Thalassophryne amazonica]